MLANINRDRYFVKTRKDFIMNRYYKKRRRNSSTRVLQVSCIIIALLAVIVIIVTGCGLLKKNNNSNLDNNNKPGTISGEDKESEHDLEENKEQENDNVITPSVTPEVTPETTPQITPSITPDVDGNGNITEIPGDGNDDSSATMGGNVISNQKMIALTFDDGPYPPVTNRILEVLEENGAKATFFVMGNRMDEFGETVEKAYSLGCQIGNHTFSHKDLTKLDAEGIRYEVQHSNENISKYAPVGKAVLRPPYGAKNDLVYKTVDVPMITWSVDPEDWKSRDKDQVIKNIIDVVQDGDIVLMHDLYSSTADAMEVVIPKLIEMGYQLVTVDELFEAKGITLQAGNIYRNAKTSTNVVNHE